MWKRKNKFRVTKEICRSELGIALQNWVQAAPTAGSFVWARSRWWEEWSWCGAAMREAAERKMSPQQTNSNAMQKNQPPEKQPLICSWPENNFSKHSLNKQTLLIFSSKHRGYRIGHFSAKKFTDIPFPHEIFLKNVPPSFRFSELLDFSFSFSQRRVEKKNLSI